jgi:hypothetical protein
VADPEDEPVVSPEIVVEEFDPPTGAARDLLGRVQDWDVQTEPPTDISHGPDDATPVKVADESLAPVILRGENLDEPVDHLDQPKVGAASAVKEHSCLLVESCGNAST